MSDYSQDFARRFRSGRNLSKEEADVEFGRNIGLGIRAFLYVLASPGFALYYFFKHINEIMVLAGFSVVLYFAYVVLALIYGWPL
jgi:hypothetical protein